MQVIPGVLAPAEVARVRALIDAARWIDGNATSGHQSAHAKHNRQLDEDSPAAREAGALVLDALGRSARFVAAALPLKVYPPLFNHYGVGDGFGDHVDTAIRIRRGSDFRIRTDLSATLFLADPGDYDGGELLVAGAAPVKLPAGDMLLYPASNIHRVVPVTRGARVASFFWIQSMVRDPAARTILLDLDEATQAIAAAQGESDPATLRLTAIYHNLLRRWADV